MKPTQKFSMITRIVVLAFVVLLAACRQESSAPIVVDPSSERVIEQGTLVGFKHPDNQAHVWRSIPYAAPPVDDLRWRAPRPAANWTGTREALDHAPWCAQIRRKIDDGSSADAVPLGDVMGQEDCLYLNIFAPEMSAEAAAEANLPVMMWIHGGSNVWGRAEQYDPSKLAADQNVIVAVVQYRLGLMGWFAHDAVQASAETPEDGSANFAILDQIAALDWLKKNARQFGGNPENITVFGESAGGHNIAALLASPKAKGKFQKAIIQSGLFKSLTLEEARKTHPRASETIAARVLGEDVTATRLRGATVADLFDALGDKGIVTSWAPPRIIEDGIVVPFGGIMNALKSRATYNAVPVITGTNRDETKLFNVINDELVGWWFYLAPYARDPELYNALAEYESRMWRVMAVDKPANAMVASGHDQVYAYRFDWDEAGSVFGADFSQLFGAAHALEIPFVMGQFRFLGDADKWVFTEENATERFELSSAMMRYWAEFARSGEPSNGGDGSLPQWPAWSGPQGDASLIVFDSASSDGLRIINREEKTEQIARELFADPRLETKEETCLVYRKTLFWNPRLSEFNDGRC